MKVCSVCGVEQPDEEFYRHSSIPGGVRKQCKKCRREYRKKAHEADPSIIRNQKNKWADNNRDKLNANARKNRAENRRRYKGYGLKKDFGITIEEYEVMFYDQSGLCKLCKNPEKTKHQSGHIKELAIDHDHTTHVIRGLLCWVCNTGIGKLQDDPILLRQAADYIQNSREQFESMKKENRLHELKLVPENSRSRKKRKRS